MQNENLNRFVNEDEVSKLTGMAVQTLRNWRFRGEGIPYCKIGRSVRYKVEDVYSFMENHRVKVDD